MAYSSIPPRRFGWDVPLLALLVFALLLIGGLAHEAALPTRVADVLRHPWLGGLLPEPARAAFGEVGPRPGDPIGLLLNAAALGGVLLYALADVGLGGRTRTRVKWVLLACIIAAAVYLPAAKLMLLRAQSGPASYSHDGGVIQTEATIHFLLDGRNPYVEDYTETPMAEWGFSAYRTALYHYPYLPWTFLFSAPFYLLGQAAGGYDQRLVYLLLMALALALAPRLMRDERRQLALVALLALNPVMALDLIFGQNDAFVLAWVLLALVAWQRGRTRREAGAGGTWALLGAGVLYGLACASKPTAWFFAPFFALLLADGAPPGGTLRTTARALALGALRLWPAAVTALLLLLPYIVWDAWALYDDVWRWSSGQGETGYQIWGWGGSNFVLAAGWVRDRFALWPFWLTEVLLAGPLLLWFLGRQARDNTLSNAALHYGLFLLAFFYASRFLNENYLGYILAFLALGAVADPGAQTPERPPDAPTTA
jgi:hypothetical protein